MPTSRRDFLTACTAAAGGTILTASGAGAFHPKSAKAENANSETKNSESVSASSNPEIGKPYAGWQEGEMDLHFIFTGIGESMFYLFPDGTSMLLDAADRDNRGHTNLPAIPDGTRLASEWIMRYLARVNPSGKKINYMMLSHYHSDHAGCERVSAGKTKGRGENYYLSGLANIGEHFQFTKVFDRGYPTYDQPKFLASDGYANFVRFTKYMLAQKRFTMEEYAVGEQDQIALCNAPEKYPTFHTRNICRNGVVWTGKGKETRDFYAENPKNIQHHVNENTLSIGLLIEYGPFRYFTGGDLSCSVLDANGTPVNVEAFAGKAVGPLDVCKTNHHSYRDSMPKEFTDAVQAKVYVSNVWDIHHLQENTMSNMTSAAENVLVCPTGVHPETLEKLRDSSWMANLAPESHEGGHVVVKVFDGGRKYKVYYLTAKDESMTVRNVYGPFDAKRA